MEFGCLSWPQLVTELFMVLVSLGLTVAFVVLARRRFAAGRTWRGKGLIAGAAMSGVTATLWLVCLYLGVPPFFVGVVHVPPCSAAEAASVVPEARHVPRPPSPVRPGGPLERT